MKEDVQADNIKDLALSAAAEFLPSQRRAELAFHFDLHSFSQGSGKQLL